MSSDEPAGVVFPVSADGRRSTSAVGRAVAADALRRADRAGALDAERDANWRTGYPVHFRRLVEAGLTSADAAVSVAPTGWSRCTARCAARLGSARILQRSSHHAAMPSGLRPPQIPTDGGQVGRGRLLDRVGRLAE